MTELKQYLLKIISNVNTGEPVSIPSIDMRVMRKFPDVIFQGQLKSTLIELSEIGYIKWIDDLSVQITETGKKAFNERI
jgi:Mn-dependent DtxR family transcriptional regulator